jgi:hypothetical protein
MNQIESEKGAPTVALDGVNGIIHVLRSILAEADLLMAVDGYPTIKSLREAGWFEMLQISGLGF